MLFIAFSGFYFCFFRKTATVPQNSSAHCLLCLREGNLYRQVNEEAHAAFILAESKTKTWFLFFIYRMLVHLHNINYYPACTHRWPFLYFTMYKQKSSTVSSSARIHCFYKSSMHFQVHLLQKSVSKSVIHLLLGFEGFCKLYSLMLHAHSSQMHWLYRKILLWYPACSNMHLSHNRFSHIF